MKAFVRSALLLAVFLGTQSLADEFRTWTSVRGSTVNARFVQQTGNNVVLQGSNGKQIRIPLAGLIDADRAYVRGLSGGGAAGGDWPSFRGPTRDGFAATTGINTSWRTKKPKTRWMADLDDEGYAGPAVAEGIVCLIDHKNDRDVVRAFDIKSGKERWQFDYSASGGANYGYARATPAIENGKVYTINHYGKVHCLDAKTGRKIWELDAIREAGGEIPGWRVAVSPVIDGDILVVPGGGDNAHLLGLDKNSGNVRWKGGGSFKLGYATPVVATVAGKKQYVVFNGFGLTGVDTAGKLLWKTQWETAHGVNAATPLIIGDDEIFISSGYGTGCGLYQVSGSTAQQQWKNRDIKAHFNSGLYYEGFIYQTGDPGVLVCMDPKTGKARWTQRGFEKGGIVGVDGHLIALDGSKGDVILVELVPTSYLEKGRFKPLGGKSWTAPIVAGMDLIVRNHDQLAVIDLTP